jgi:hypothetical protein
MTAVFALSGETLERYRGVVYRAKEPKQLWRDIVFYFLAVFSSSASTCTRIQTETLPSNRPQPPRWRRYNSL